MINVVENLVFDVRINMKQIFGNYSKGLRSRSLIQEVYKFGGIQTTGTASYLGSNNLCK